MGYLTSLVVAALVGQTHAYDPYDPIAGYSPSSDVTDQMHLDKDLQQLEDNLKDNLAGSLDIYNNGGHSKSIGRLKLSDTNFDSSAIVAGQIFTGTSVDGNVAIAMKLDDPEPGYLKLQYEDSGQNPCNVGGLVTPVNNGCFAASGEVTDGTNRMDYDSIEHMNALTLKSLGITGKMGSNHDMFLSYYGKEDFADHWVTQAFGGAGTDFDNGNADFSKYTIIGKIEAIKKGIAYISALQYMFYKLEMAVSSCNDGVAGVADLESWDEGVAYYVGSLQGPELTGGSGKFPYVLADKRCSNFKTCGLSPPFATGTVSWVNHNVMPKFHMGKNALVKGDCKMAQTVLDQISKLAYIPLIQGTLRYAYKVEFLKDGTDYTLEKEQAEGTVFAAAVLPVIHENNKEAAKTIYKNMKLGAKKTIFSEVKAAFEAVYGDLHINCANIGCLIESGPNTCYEEGAEACATGCTDKKTKSKTGVVVPEMGLAAITCGELAFMSAKYRHVFCANNEVVKKCPGTCLGTCLCFDDPSVCEDLWKDKKFSTKCETGDWMEICPDTCAGFCDPIPFTKKYKKPKKEKMV